jgi:APA family basic amino acid/polyamine antiporter
MKEQAEPLRRELGRTALIALAINGIVGAGIFGLPAGAAALTGAFSPWLFMLCGLLMMSVMASFALAASGFSGTGGPLLYTRTAFGPLLGFQTGWTLYVSRVASLAANANLFAVYLGGLVGGMDSGWARVAVICVLCAGFALINVLGVRQGIRSVLLISVLKFVPLLLFALIGLAWLNPDVLGQAKLPTFATAGEAALLVLYAYIGFESALIPAGESRDPRRDMPRAMITTAVAAVVLYTLIQLVCVSVLPALADSKRPLADAAGAMLGPVAAAVVGITAVVSILGNFAAAALTAPRMTYQLAREQQLPAVLGRVHPRFASPHVSILMYCGLGCALALSGTFVELAVMSSLARLLVYALCIASLPRLARLGYRSDFRLPGGMAIPALAFLTCLYLIAQVAFDSVWKTGVLIAAGMVLYALARLWRKPAPEPRPEAPV